MVPLIRSSGRVRLRCVTVVAAMCLAVVGIPGASAEADACHTPGSADYQTHGCKVERLRERSFSVVAVIDTGINPYHLDFRLPADEDLQGVHPSEFIEGYPEDVARLDLTLEAPSYQDAVSADQTTWDGVDPDEPVWIPGTNIISAIGPLYGSGLPGNTFLDQDGHGTGTASLAGGYLSGPGSRDVLLVVVKETSFIAHVPDALQWVAHQPWIDFVSNSYIDFSHPMNPGGVIQGSRDAAALGKIQCWAAGNNYTPSAMFGGQGPSWNVHVGASTPSRGEGAYTGYPNDVLANGLGPVARLDSLTERQGFGGTSGSTPVVCGQIARTLARARGFVGDPIEGPHGGALAIGSAGGAFQDGKLTVAELEDAVQSTAVPAITHEPLPDNDVLSVPASPVAPWVRGGYGIVDRQSADHAFEVITGTKPRPHRPDEDAWIAQFDQARDGIWGGPPQPLTLTRPRAEVTIGALEAAVSGSEILVSGNASFTDVPVQVGVDFEDDASLLGEPALGAEVTGAWISRPDPRAEELVFRMTAREVPPAGRMNHEYRWPVKVASDERDFYLRGTREYVDTSFLQLMNAQNGLVAALQGSIDGDAVEFRVPMSLIGAAPGDVLSRAAVSDFGTAPRGTTFGGDLIWWTRPYEIPVARVDLGIAPTSVPMSEVPLTERADIDWDAGTFSAELTPTETADEYRVVARVCYGPHNCALAEVLTGA